MQAGPALDGMRIIQSDTYSIIAASELALVASGTATLETALLGCPMVIAYKMSPLTYAVARMLVTRGRLHRHAQHPGRRTIVPELIQGEVTAANLVRAAEPMLRGSDSRRDCRGSARRRARASGAPGAAARVAAIALAMIA